MDMLAEVFPPGDFLREELDARGWTQGDLAEITGRPVETISRLVTGKLSITPETARGLGAAFGTSADYWLNLESAYQLAQVTADESVARRARVYSMAPVKDMIRRGWIEKSSNVAVLERQVIEFYELQGIDEDPEIDMAARKSNSYSAASVEQVAWYYRARQLASQVVVKPYTKKKLVSALDKLRSLAIHENECRHVPAILAEAGVRFVVVEHLPKSKIDGAAFWLDAKKAKEPAIAVSIRYDRIDGFWHTVLHEICHVLERDGIVVDTDLINSGRDPGEDRPDEEVRADAFASQVLVKPEELEDFIVRIRPLYSKRSILGFANRIGVHPGIVVGQLQHRGEIPYSHSREMLVKVREVVAGSALTDGWGHSA